MDQLAQQHPPHKLRHPQDDSGLWKRAIRRVRMGYVLALLIVASLATINHLAATYVTQAQERATALTQIVSNQRTTVDEVRTVINTLMRSIDLDNLEPHIQNRISSRLMELAEQIAEQNAQLENSAGNYVTSKLLALDVDSILFEEPYQLLFQLESLQIKMLELSQVRDDAINWRFGIWAPLAMMLAPQAPLDRALRHMADTLLQQATRIAVRAQRIQNGLFAFTLLTLLMELLFIFRPLLRRLEAEHYEVFRLNSELDYQAHHDYLTEMGNRRKLTNDFNALLKTQSHKGMTLIMLDVDHFKSINDLHGQQLGDSILKTIGEILSQYCRKQPFSSYRLSGDEFALIGPRMEYANVLHQCQDLQKMLATQLEEYCIAQKKLNISVELSVGFVIKNALQANDRTLLMTQCDRALRRAKKNKPSAMHGVDLSSINLEHKEARIMAALMGSNPMKDLVVYYQPIYSVSEQKIISVEALARWQNDQFGLLSPRDFLPIIEDMDMMDEMTEAIFAQCAKDQAALCAQGLPKIRFSINASESFLVQQGLLNKALNFFNKEDYAWLQIEILETVLLNRSATKIKDNLERFRQAGGQVALDDFGTGYASLSHLHEFPCDVIKLDKTFMQSLTTESRTQVLLSGVSSIIRNLNKKIIAEGVENLAQQKLLSTWGVDYIQGYLYYKAMRFEELQAVLQENNKHKKAN